MRKRTLKNVFIISLVLLMVLQQGSFFTGTAAPGVDNDSKLSIAIDGDPTPETTIIKVKEIEGEDRVQKVELHVPQGATFDSEKTKSLGQEQADVTYKADDRKVIIEWNTVSSEQQVKVVFKNLEQPTYLFTAEGIYGETKVKSNELAIQMPAPVVEEKPAEEAEVKKEEEKPAEEIEVVEEKPVEETEAVEEEKPTEETEAVEEEKPTEEVEVVEEEKPAEETEAVEEEKPTEETEVVEEEKSTEEAEAAEPNQGDTTDKQDIRKQETETSNMTPFVGDLNTDIDISPVNNTILSGQDAIYKLTLKLTGSKREYKNVELVVDLPISEHVTFDDSNLASLAIDNVTPSYDSDTHQLKYHFEQIDRGQTYEKIISLNTTNGYMVEGTELPVTATISGDIHFTENDEAAKEDPIEIAPFEYTDDALVTISTSSAVSISKDYIRSEANAVPTPAPIPNGFIFWELKVSIPKSEFGQNYLMENGEITITDELPAGWRYFRTDLGPNSPIVDGTKITWTFDAPTLAEQSETDGDLFTTTIRFWSQQTNETGGAWKENKAKVEATFLDGNRMEDNTSRSVYILTALELDGDVRGNYIRQAHMGPTDGEGNFTIINTSSDLYVNNDPIVSSDALLGFAHNFAIGGYETYDTPGLPKLYQGDFEKYSVDYKIDPNLILETLKTPGKFFYKPVAANPPTQQSQGMTLDHMVHFDIYATVDGERKLLIENAPHDTIFTREELGLTEDDDVTSIYYNFTDGNGNDFAPHGIFSSPDEPNDSGKAVYKFTVKPDTVGQVKNDIVYSGKNHEGIDFTLDYGKLAFPWTMGGSRTAQINPELPPHAPISSVGVSLKEHNAGRVTVGENRMEVVLTNTSISNASMNGPLEGVVLLPTGVTLNSEPKASYTNVDGNELTGNYEVLDENYNGSGRQLVKVIWDIDKITPNGPDTTAGNLVNRSLTAALDVNIAEGAPNRLQFDIYGFTGDEELRVPESSGTAITDSIILQTDEEDLNNDGVIDQPRIKSGNVYSLAGDYDLQTEKSIKGPNDEEYSKFTIAKPEEIVDYKLKMTNTTGKDLSSITLIDVLPSIGDLGITDNISRGSTFEPTLVGPITIPAEWQGKVNVFYSTAKNPKRDDLTRHTVYPDTTTPLTNPDNAEAPNWISESEVSDWNSIHSFKIELIDGNTWIMGQDIEIDFKMLIPELDELADEVKNCDVVPQQRAAWNSFAVATDHGQPVEPERVGVAIDCTPKTGSLEIAKVDDTTGAVLQGAEFELRKCEVDANDAEICEVVASGTTDENGKLLFEDIPLGDYKLVETKAPEGYNLLTTPLDIKITESGQVLEFEVENTKTGWDLPDTGGMGTILFYAVGALLMIGAAILLLRKRKSSV